MSTPTHRLAIRMEDAVLFGLGSRQARDATRSGAGRRGESGQVGRWAGGKRGKGEKGRQESEGRDVCERSALTRPSGTLSPRRGRQGIGNKVVNNFLATI